MTVCKLPTGKWLCECYHYGASGQSTRKTFATKGEALSFERRLMGRVREAGHVVSTQTLFALISRWYEMHGKSLVSDAERKSKLDVICERLNDPLVDTFDKNMFAVYRERRLRGEWNPKGKKQLKEAMVNREYSYLHAFFLN